MSEFDSPESGEVPTYIDGVTSRSLMFLVISEMEKVDAFLMYPELRGNMESSKELVEGTTNLRVSLVNSFIKLKFSNKEIMATIALCTIIRSASRIKKFIYMTYYDFYEDWMDRVNTFIDHYCFSSISEDNRSGTDHALHKIADSFMKISSMIWAFYYSCTDSEKFMQNIWAKKLRVADDLAFIQRKWEEDFWNKRVPKSKPGNSKVCFSEIKWRAAASYEEGFCDLQGNTYTPSYGLNKEELEAWLLYINTGDEALVDVWKQVPKMSNQVVALSRGNRKKKDPKDNMPLREWLDCVEAFNHEPSTKASAMGEANWVAGMKNPESYKHAISEVFILNGMDYKDVSFAVAMCVFSRDIITIKKTMEGSSDIMGRPWSTKILNFISQKCTSKRGKNDISNGDFNKKTTMVIHLFSATYPSLFAMYWATLNRIENPKMIVKHLWAAQLNLDPEMLSYQVRWEKAFVEGKFGVRDEENIEKDEHFWNLKTMDKVKLLKLDGNYTTFMGEASYSVLKEWLMTINSLGSKTDFSMTYF